MVVLASSQLMGPSQGDLYHGVHTLSIPTRQLCDLFLYGVADQTVKERAGTVSIVLLGLWIATKTTAADKQYAYIRRTDSKAEVELTVLPAKIRKTPSKQPKALTVSRSPYSYRRKNYTTLHGSEVIMVRQPV